MFYMHGYFTKNILVIEGKSVVSYTNIFMFTYTNVLYDKILFPAAQMVELDFDVLVPNCEVLKENVEFNPSEIAIM